ncbi:hypothetical protein [Streptacidiphilus fuscans]|uniref:Uncharacterized protein n=1 Tax=Streptacidiphilus fuscans TaxID=2789292 RepID=A0A931FJX9_9ACTN|nr:hypothetical protein [Streptacidiphilus fuscans]MBF9073159.1 hypothetical protein [Streptacidiphilus fuscans]
MPSPTLAPTKTVTAPAPSPATPTAAASTAHRSDAPADVACRNLAVPADVKWAVTQTWANAKRIYHIQPKPGEFYYGSCGTTLYAAARFEAAAGATDSDLVQLQDEGSVLQFFRFTPSTGWAFTGSDSFPPTSDCSQAVPAALSHQWHCS